MIITMKTHLVILIAAVLFPFIGVTQQSPYTKSTGSARTISASTSAKTNVSQPSQSYSGGSSVPRAAQTATHQMASVPSSRNTSSTGYQSQNMEARPIAIKVRRGADVRVLNADASRQGIIVIGSEVTSGGQSYVDPVALNQAMLHKIQYDTLQGIVHQLQPVKFYRRNLKQVALYRLGGYGVQVAAYKSLSECRQDLIKYKSRFKVAGFVCEDWNIFDANFRLILGKYSTIMQAQKLYLKLRAYFPRCFIIKYA